MSDLSGAMRATEVAPPLAGPAPSTPGTERRPSDVRFEGDGDDGRRRRGERGTRRRPRGQSAAVVRTSRVVLKHIDPWTVLKVSALFYLSAWFVVLTAGALLWGAAAAAGVVENIEGFIESVGFADFRFLPMRILRGFALGGLVLVVAGSLANVLMTVLFNLISEVLGGIKLVLAEDVERNRTV